MRNITKCFLGAVATMAIYVSGAFAAPIVWTIPETVVRDVSDSSITSTVSGTFTYDTSTSTLSAINIISVGTIQGTYTYPSIISSKFIAGQQNAIATGTGEIIFDIKIQNLPAAGGTYTTSILGLVACNTVTNNLCTNGQFVEDNFFITITGAPPAAPVATSIPTLNECALMALGLALAISGVWHMRRRKEA